MSVKQFIKTALGSALVCVLQLAFAGPRFEVQYLNGQALLQSLKPLADIKKNEFEKKRNYWLYI